MLKSSLSGKYIEILKPLDNPSVSLKRCLTENSYDHDFKFFDWLSTSHKRF